MRNLTTRTIVATVAVALASATLVEAAPKRRPTRDPLLRMAVDVENSTEHLQRQADRRSFGRLDRHERRALDQLATLSHQSRVFRRTLAHNGPYSFRSEREFRRLERALSATQCTFPALRPDRRLRSEFRHVNRLLAELDHGFESRLASFRGRHGRAIAPGVTRKSASISLGKPWNGGRVNVTYVRRD